VSVKEKPVLVCAFTGHRTLAEDFNQKNFEKVLSQLVKQGVSTFYCGMAVGFDTLAAEAVIKLKKKYPALKLVACIPCVDQDKFFSPSQKEKYAKLIALADEKTTLFQRYTPGCMQARNRYMADAADILVAHLYKNEGGTAYTVDYFRRKYPEKTVIIV